MVYSEGLPEGYSAPPKKKKRKRTSPVRVSYPSDSGNSIASVDGRNYNARPTRVYNPTSSAPPSYLQLPTKPAQSTFSGPKPPKKKDGLLDGVDTLRHLLSGETLESRRQKSLDTSGPGANKRQGLEEFLEGLVKPPKAPEGYVPDVPRRVKYTKNGDLKRHWDEDFYTDLSDFNGDQNQINFFLNGIMEQQFKDREDFMLRRNFKRGENIQEILKNAASQAGSYDDEPGNFNWLGEYAKEHPKFNLDPITYRSQFGVTSDDVYNAWLKEREKLTPEQRESGRYLVDMKMRHYDKIQRSYQKTNRFIRDQIDNYERKYGEAVEFGENSSDDDIREAAENAGPALPGANVTSKEDQEIYDAVGGQENDLQELLTGALSPQGRRKVNRDVRKQDRQEVKEALGIKRLPSMRDMLAAKVAEGTLDPTDDAAVESWIDRFKNSDHPETRAMYVAFAVHENPDFDAEGLGVDYINEPIDAYGKKLEEEAKEEAESGSGGPMPGPMGVIGQGFSKIGSAFNTPVDAGTNLVGWTFDKLARPIYGVAAAANAVYQADDEPSEPWSGKNGFLGSIVDGAVDPLSLFTGKSVLDSADEFVSSPGPIIDTADATYQQLFRGWNDLPGIKDHVVPTTFSQVIANNAARDGEGDLYDQEWFQHVSGFALDVTVDPLNLIGVGVVSNTLKLPAKVMKVGLAEKAVEGVTPAEGLRWINRPDSSPVAEQVFNVRQGLLKLGDELEGTEIVNDVELNPANIYIQKRTFPEDDGLTTAPNYFGMEFTNKADIRKELNTQKKLLLSQKQKVVNDTGLAHLLEQSESLNDELGTIVTTPLDIRVSNLLADQSTVLKPPGLPGQVFENVGGKWWRQLINPVHLEARSRGFMRTEFADSERGIKAREAIEGKQYPGGKESPPTTIPGMNQIDELIAAGKLDARDAAVIKQRESLQYHIDRGHEIDPQTGLPSIRNVTDMEKYLKAGAPGKKQATSFDPVAVFAQKYSMTREQFVKYVATPEELDEAFFVAPELYAKSDPVAGQQFMDAQARIHGAQAKIDSLPTYPRNADEKQVLHNSYESLAIGYSQMSEFTMGAVVRYLGDLHQAKLAGQVPVGEIDELERFRDVVDDVLAKESENQLVMTDEYGVNREIDSLMDKMSPEELAAYSNRLNDPNVAIDKVGSSLSPEMAKLRGLLGEEDSYGLRSLTQKEAPYAEGDPIEHVLNMAPNTKMRHSLEEAISGETKIEQLESLVRSLDNTISAMRNTARVEGFPPNVAYKVSNILKGKSQFKNPDGSLNMQKIENAFEFDEANNNVTYIKGSDYTHEEFAFLDILRNAIKNEYLGAYRAESKLAREAKDAKNPVQTFKSHEEHFIETEGPRPTSASLAKSNPQMYAKTVKAGDHRPVIREYIELAPQKGVKAPRIKLTKTERKILSIEKALNEGGKLNKQDIKFLRSLNKPVKKEYTATSFQREFIEALKDKFPNMVRVSKEANHDKWVHKVQVIEGGTKTPGQKDWANWVKNKQREYDRDLLKAKEMDAEGAKFRKSQEESKPAFTAGEMQTLKQRSYHKAMNGVLKSLDEAGEIKRVPGNERTTINAQASAIKRKAKLDNKYKKLQLQIKKIEATDGQAIKAIDSQISALNTQLRRIYDKVEKTRVEAIQTAKVMHKRVGEEHLLQMLMAPPRMDGKMFYIQLLGMRKNLQFTNSMFRGMEKATHLLPAKTREAFANYMVRPTKKMSLQESIHFRAIWTSQTPFVVAAHLKRLSGRMRNIPEAERHSMLQAYRDGVDYAGPSNNLYDGVKHELDEMMSIWNKTHDFHQFNVPDGKGIGSLEPHEILRFLPKEWQPDLKVLFKSRAVEGREEFILDDLIGAIRASGHNPPGLYDPFRMSWVMNLAADQARQLRTVHNLIKTQFGVKVPYADNLGDAARLGTKRKIVEQLKDKYGWKEIPRLLDGDGVSRPSGLEGYVFPPESHKDIKELLEMTLPGPKHHNVSKIFDQAMGYWKQGMTIYNPGYYTRNGVGEILVSYLDGVNHPKWYRMAWRVHKFSKGIDVNKAQLLKEWNVLEGKIHADPAKSSEYLFSLNGGVKVHAGEAYQMYQRYGLGSTFVNTDLNRGVRALAGSALTDSKVKKGARAVNELAHGLGEGFEDYLRMAHFLHAMQHSGKGTLKAAAEAAAKRVTRSHFDYTDFSKFEQTFMLRAFPFYKWTRRGAPLMLAHLFMTPGKMLQLPKAMDTLSGLGFDPMNAMPGDDPLFSTQDVHEDKNGFLPDYQNIAPAWVKDLFAYQMQPAPDDEYANYFRLQTPQIDGLNAALSLVPREDYSPLEAFGDTAAYPLLNPIAKMGLELFGPGGQEGLVRNQGLDPDFPYEIVGGEYNAQNGINPVESLITYVARNINPLTGFLAKLSKNGDLGPLSMGEGDYRNEHGYDASRDITSYATGAGLYQGKVGQPSDDSNPSTPAVGRFELSELPLFRGAPAALVSPEKKSGKRGYKGVGSYPTTSEGYGSGSSWVDYGSSSGSYGGYSGYGGGGYGGGYSSGSGYSSSSSGMELWELLESLKRLVDQGKVIDE